jgi:hypothetical protein
MNGTLVAILTQAMLLFGASAGFNQPSSASSSDYYDKVSTETIQKSLNLKPGGLILLDTEFGNVSLKEYDGREVKVELKLRGTPEGISKFRFTHNFFGNQLTLKGWCENGSGPRGSCLRQVDFVIMIPRGSSYAVRATTKQGSIDAAISGNMKGVELSTEAGSVRVELPSNLSADIDASTSGIGRVRVSPISVFSELCPECEVFRSDSLKVRMNGGGAAINAYSGIGSVYFEITQAKKSRPS